MAVALAAALVLEFFAGPASQVSLPASLGHHLLLAHLVMLRQPMSFGLLNVPPLFLHLEAPQLWTLSARPSPPAVHLPVGCPWAPAQQASPIPRAW